MGSIKHSVGKYSTNNSADVVEVQTLLNKFIDAGVLEVTRLVVDGDCGSLTKGAIDFFQRLKFGWTKPDGKVDAVGQTIDALNGPTWQTMKGDPLDSLRFTTMDVLKSPYLNAVEFTLEGRRYQPGDYKPISDFVRDRKIHMDWVMGMDNSAAYFHIPNRFELGFTEASTTLQKSVIVHEATHAICDKRARAMPVEEGEAAGHIAQCLFYRKATGRHIHEITYPPTAAVLMVAGNIAIDIMNGDGVKEAPLKQLYEKIDKLPTTTKGAFFFYDGIA
ncbi:MAG: hypothetical protein ABI972_25745 [Acidobacteriota bacterium]